MTNTPVTNQISKLTQWLLAVTMVFSVFTFSGYSDNTQSTQRSTQTEVLIVNNYKTCARTISYKKSFECISVNDPLSGFRKNWTNALVAYNKLISATRGNTLQLFYFRRQAGHLLHTKTIPQRSDEHISAAQLG